MVLVLLAQVPQAEVDAGAAVEDTSHEPLGFLSEMFRGWQLWWDSVESIQRHTTGSTQHVVFAGETRLGKSFHGTQNCAKKNVRPLARWCNCCENFCRQMSQDFLKIISRTFKRKSCILGRHRQTQRLPADVRKIWVQAHGRLADYRTQVTISHE